MDDFNNNELDDGVNLFKAPEPNESETQNDGGVNLSKEPEPTASEQQSNGGVNFNTAPEPTASEPQNNGGVNLGIPKPPANDFQGVSNAQQGMNFSGQQNFNGIPNQPVNGQGLAIASLVLGILSILGACCCNLSAAFLPLNLPVAIIGIICGVISNKKGKSGLATGGIVTSIIGTVFGFVCLILWVLVVIGAMSSPELFT